MYKHHHCVVCAHITSPLHAQALKKEANGGMMDVVVHDGAPNVGGVWSSEAYSQSWLVLEALKLATEFLTPNGTFVTKVFRCATNALSCITHVWRMACTSLAV